MMDPYSPSSKALPFTNRKLAKTGSLDATNNPGSEAPRSDPKLSGGLLQLAKCGSLAFEQPWIIGVRVESFDAEAVVRSSSEMSYAAPKQQCEY